MRKIIALLFFVAAFHSEAKIIATNKINDIEAEFAKADNETLIALDCDDVLIELCDNILSSPNRKFLNTIADEFIKSVKKSSPKTTSERDIFISFLSIILRDAKCELLNDKWPALIAVLQSRGIKVVLLSACYTGKLGVIKSMQKWRYNQLTAFGIDFKKSWDSLEQMTFSEFGNNKGYPIFYNGMLLSAAATKGETLKAFLSKIPQYKFKKIVFIDDRIDHVKSVETEANDLRIEYVGVEYTYARTKKRPPLNLEKAKKQFEILVKERRWVSDEEMEKIFSR
jgi:hypothetical protein